MRNAGGLLAARAEQAAIAHISLTFIYINTLHTDTAPALMNLNSNNSGSSIKMSAYVITAVQCYVPFFY